MRSRLAPRWRVTVLIALGAWAVHQLRYALAFGADADAHLEAHQHDYLDLAGPALLWMAALAAACWVVSLSRSAGELGPAPAWRTVWMRASSALIAIYCVQEAGEGLLAPGHPDLLAGMFGSGGWIAIPLSAAVGALAALAVRGARAVRTAVARARAAAPASSSVASPAPHAQRAGARLRRRPPVLASNLAGRAPPLAV
jgi:hypothetical protein